MLPGIQKVALRHARQTAVRWQRYFPPCIEDEIDSELCYWIHAGRLMPRLMKDEKMWEPCISFLSALPI